MSHTIFIVFTLAKRDRVFSRYLVSALENKGDRPWLELRRGRQVTEAWLAQLLRPYGIKPRTLRIGEEVGRGYVEGDFIDTFRRYIPKTEVEALKTELAERTTQERETETSKEGTAAVPPISDEGQACAGEGK